MQLAEAHALDNAAADLGSGLDIRGLCSCVAFVAALQDRLLRNRRESRHTSENPKDKETDGSRLPQRGGGR